VEAQAAPGGQPEVEGDPGTSPRAGAKSALKTVQAAVLLLLLVVLLSVLVSAVISGDLHHMAWLPTPVSFAVVTGTLLALSVASVAWQPRNLLGGCIFVVAALDCSVVTKLDTPRGANPFGLLVLVLGVCGLLVATTQSSHRRGLKLPVGVIVLAGMALALLGPATALNGCERVIGLNHVILDQKSPDGRWTLLVNDSDPGAMASAWYTVSVRREFFGCVQQERELYSGLDAHVNWVDNATVSVNGQAVNIFAKTTIVNSP